MSRVKSARNLQGSLIVAVVFVGSMLACMIAFQYERQRNLATNLIQFEQESAVIEYSLKTTFDAYAHVLRSGVALFNATENVDRETWRIYVESLELEDNFPGIQGVSFNAALHSRADFDALAEDVRATDMPSFNVRPDGERDLYTPILYLEPLEGRNRPALGFDIYAEPTRRDAIDRAIATRRPQMTSKITLVQDDDSEDETVKAGVLVVLPVLEGDTGTLDDVSGLIVSVFRIRDLMETILSDNFGDSGERRKDVTLFEVAPSGDVLPMFERHDETSSDPWFTFENTFEMYGRTWRLITTSTSQFETATSRNSHWIILLIGSLASLLLTSLIWGQVIRGQESQNAADQLERSNTHIALLMKEVNHRSKNLLGLIQAIARQTSAASPGDFSASFGRRLSSLAASQDLLVKNSWNNVGLEELIKAQLGHFSGLIGSRILVSGSNMEIDSQNAQTLSMAIHELATNASKYGALSNDVGVVDIGWNQTGVGGEAQFELNWIESGGPPVTAPTRKGFGSKVTGMMVKMSLESEIEMDYATKGFAWRLTCPARNLTANIDLPNATPNGERA